MEKIKILLAEDDVNLGSLLEQYLKAKNYTVDLCTDGEIAFKYFRIREYDICILDVMMPKIDGFTLARDMKTINPKMPVIFLTAKTLKDDVLEGFKIGADDYITKPFNMEELIFRIEAVLRRSGNGQESEKSIYELGKISFDPQKQLIIIGNKEIKLTTKESELLKMLCDNINGVLERNYALKAIWKDDNYFNARSMDVYITKLRKHLKAEESLQIINVHGKGYKLIMTS
jgi:DNA-binding response OmpR family regulator